MAQLKAASSFGFAHTSKFKLEEVMLEMIIATVPLKKRKIFISVLRGKVISQVSIILFSGGGEGRGGVRSKIRQELIQGRMTAGGGGVSQV